MKKVIGGKMYDTEKAERIGHNEFADGTNRMPHGRCTSIYKTAKGKFFMHCETCWQGEHDSIAPLTKQEAKDEYEHMINQVDYVDAFGEEPEEA
ncbi:MAG: hypothetical protein ABII06_21205 [Pseudomonadota bacterium]